MIRHQFVGFNGHFFDLTYAGSPIFLTADSVEGMGDPPATEFTQETPLVDGQQFTGYRFKAREVFWPVVVSSTPENFQTDNAYLWGGLDRFQTGVWTVIAPDLTERHLSVRLSDDGGSPLASDPTRDGVAKYGITLVADDPYWKGDTVSKTFQTAQDDLDAFPPGGADYTLWLGSSGTVDNATISNPGTVDSWPVIRVDGPATEFWVDWVDEADQPDNPTFRPIAGSIDIADGQYLEINTDPRILTVRLYSADGSYVNAFRQMSAVRSFAFPAGLELPVYMNLVGEGSMTVSLEPRFTRAF